MKIEFNWDDGLPVKKTLELHKMVTIVRCIFHEGNKYYPQYFLDNVCMK